MLYIFDWDGTLVDSTERIVACLEAAANRCELPVLAPDTYQNIIGLGLVEACRVLYPDLDDEGIEALKRAYSEAFVAADVEPCQFFPGVGQVLRKLSEQGHRLAIATGKSRRGLDRAMAALGIEDWFVATRCADETRSKPHPLMLEQILLQTGYDVSESFMVGDTEYDLEMAQRAGIPSIGVTCGAHTVDRLLKWRPAAILPSVAAIQPLAA